MPYSDEADVGLGDHVVPLERYGPSQSSSLKLTPLDMSMPRLYGARWVLCFPLPPGTDKDQVYNDLKIGLSHTIMSIPWLAGEIGPEEGSDLGNNRIQIVDSPGGVRFPCKDLSEILPSYEDLRKERFPLSRLSTAELGPIGVFPEASQPVMAAQANFVENGLLLTVGVHHSACDAAAMDAIVSTWSHNTAAAGGSHSFTTHDARSNDRSPLMEGMPGARIVDFPEYKLPASGDVKQSPVPPTGFQLPLMAAHVFYFSPESLADLKTAAAAFSTHDALCAFLWRHMTLARRVPSSSPGPLRGEETSVLAFAVNIRGRASPPLPPAYLGNASMISVTDRLAVSTITMDGRLPAVAKVIRKSLGAFGSPSRVPLAIGLLQSRPDPMELKLAYNAFLGPDIVATSWADLKIYDGDWGFLGKVDAFRVPGEGADGMVTIFPRLHDGGLEVMVGLELGAMERLLQNSQFLDAARHWG